MHNLGQTRSSYQRTHLLQTPDTFVRSAFPGINNALAIIHAAPQMGAAFTQYTVEFEADGVLGHSSTQRFLYLLEGSLEIRLDGSTQSLQPGGYAYLPEGLRHEVFASVPSRAAVIEKHYEATHGIQAGAAIFGHVDDVASNPLGDDADLRVQLLIPAEPGYDCAVNVMRYQPGASLAMVEIHVMEHGLLMLEGQGIYRLGDSWYPVQSGDFIWMAPYCPQWFGALGKKPAKYLIYKNTNRHPITGV
jgi:(S)-ureidoglycine aminohydrolase